MLPSFPNSLTKAVTEWSNYSGTLGVRPVPVYCTPDKLKGTSGTLVPQADAIRAVLGYCWANDEPLRVLGTAYSFSTVIEPSKVVLDPTNMDTVWRVSTDYLTKEYRGSKGAEGFVPVFVQGGTTISYLNKRLAESGLALQTSGAGDGHRIAGCIATGTHGSALRVGAVHDTVLGIHLVVGPDQAVFIQASTSPVCNQDYVALLESQTGIPTTMVQDDNAFLTALVSLGSLGFVFSVVIETCALYRFARKTIVRPWNDARIWEAIRTLDTAPLHRDYPDMPPHHFEVVFHPYPPDDDPGAYVTLLWKMPAGSRAPTHPSAVPPDMASDNMGCLASLVQGLDGVFLAPIATPIIRSIINDQLAKRFANSNGSEGYPGEFFGPTTLPAGRGASTEIVVAHADVVDALKCIFSVLREGASSGRHLLGAVAVRFIPRTSAFLGMNIFGMNAYIELPSIRTPDVLELYTRCWDWLTAKQIAYTCHWGQQHAMGEESVGLYFGDRVQSWKDARAKLLDETARRIFAAPLLAEVGLDG